MLVLNDKRGVGTIKVTDKIGNEEQFQNVKEASNALGVSTNYIYQGIRLGVLVRGCKIEKIG